MSYVIGVALAVVIGAMGRWSRMDRDRAFYPTQLMAIAGLYVLFALLGGSRQALVEDSGVAALYVAAALIGFRRSMRVVAAALAVHGVMDLFHGQLIDNAGVPAFWPSFCSAYDLTAALWLLRLERRVPVRPFSRSA